jgi:uncharacterized protein
MKKPFVSIVLYVLLGSHAWAQSKPAKILFDVTSKDPSVQETAVRHVALMAEAYPDAQLEVVVYGGALPMFLKEGSTVSDKITSLSNNKNITFAACAVTMKRHNVDQSQLLPGVSVVPDAIMEIVSKQNEGWGYIKEVAY